MLQKLFSNNDPEKEAGFLVQMVCESAFTVFRDGQFRKLIDFEKRDQEDQNRIFNELEVTGLILLLFLIDDSVQFVNIKRKKFWSEVRDMVSETFLNWMGSMGIEDQFLDIWKNLIDERENEYKERIEILREHLKKNVFNSSELAKKPIKETVKRKFIRLECFSFGCAEHMPWKKPIKDQKALQQHLKSWILVLDIKLAKRILY
ncbi:MAG: hypothetical protein UR66_C0007G0008 [Candidatus Moranbacteria bacterium GW2011_GWE1_35_17]|nr:MAG: hypothetical protein UR66_C0007G0008 [Candidatus Moranbacteria bacterium GW2011_GWE1_35_17]KKP82223.1 MAG: hypothetical protein UR83_C0055G0007 [Candidatus Moranbacteria bacterium GW2011_GWF2_35_54]KKP83292.1 MAG: hypothetical protein UR82_C0023G0021 [Candidatus Moranbacteria bacterium GW2011_GWF1_35_5]HBR79356.1 hypothetical protein [Candidatus Moranbacteria bacterium]